MYHGTTDIHPGHTVAAPGAWTPSYMYTALMNSNSTALSSRTIVLLLSRGPHQLDLSGAGSIRLRTPPASAPTKLESPEFTVQSRMPVRRRQLLIALPHAQSSTSEALPADCRSCAMLTISGTPASGTPASGTPASGPAAYGGAASRTGHRCIASAASRAASRAALALYFNPDVSRSDYRGFKLPNFR